MKKCPVPEQQGGPDGGHENPADGEHLAAQLRRLLVFLGSNRAVFVLLHTRLNDRAKGCNCLGASFGARVIWPDVYERLKFDGTAGSHNNEGCRLCAFHREGLMPIQGLAKALTARLEDLEQSGRLKGRESVVTGFTPPREGALTSMAQSRESW